MAHKNPIGSMTGLAIYVLRHPWGTAGKMVEQARGTASIGRMVAGQLTRTAVGAVVDRTTHGAQPSSRPTSPADLRPVSPIDGPTPSAVAVDAPARPHGDPVFPHAEPGVRRPGARKAPAQAPAAKAAKKAPAAKAAKKAPAAKTAEVDVTPADVAKVVAKKAPVKKAPAAKAPAAKAPVAKAPAAKKSAAKKTAAEKTSETPAKKAPARKTAAKKAAKKAPTKAPAKRAAAPTGTGPDTSAPSDESVVVFSTDSSQGAGSSDTGHLEQPLIDPAVAKEVAAEAATGQAGADVDKG